MRLHGAAGLPENGRLFAFGGNELFRGYDIRQRQGNMNWIASLEWRVPLWREMGLSMCDHVATGNNLYAALFCDTGNSYINGHTLGSIAYAPGIGLRWDVSWFGLIERTTLRFDVARTINDNSPWQFWVGIQHPF
jgi:hemolysin activation/secretion protein